MKKKIFSLVILLILIGAFGVRLYKVNNPIADWHSWRQSDTASVTRIYLDKGLNLLKPQYYDISSVQTGYQNPEGLRFVEFPIFNLIHYLFVQVLPNQSFVVLGRMVSILSAVATTYFLYRIGKHLFGTLEGLAAAFVYAFIPFNIFFTRVILPDPLSVAFSIASIWFFLLFYKKENKYHLFLSGLLFSLALLTKPHAIFLGFPIVALILSKYKLKNIFQNIPMLLTLAIVTIPFFLWRNWIEEGRNFIGIPHLSWAFNGDGIRFRPSFWRWIFGYRIGIMILGVWGILPFVYGVLSLKKNILFMISFLFGTFAYVAVIATANVRHDYYQTFIIPSIALATGVGIIAILKNANFNKYLRWSTVTFSVAMMLLMGWDQVKGFYQINHYEIVTAGEAVDRLTPPDSKVVAPYNGDSAFLYQTGRFGWPIIETTIEDLIDKGADYYVSVNKNDSDSAKFKERFAIVEETDNYIILDLNKEL